jgi:hypothetical protein
VQVATGIGVSVHVLTLMNSSLINSTEVFPSDRIFRGFCSVLQNLLFGTSAPQSEGRGSSTGRGISVHALNSLQFGAPT